MSGYDMTFVGHMCFDEIIPYGGEARVAPGSAVLCGAVVAARVGKRVAAVVKMARRDMAINAQLVDAKVAVHVIPAEETSYVQVIHPCADVDVRRLVFPKTAGLITADEIPPIQTAYMHMAGISDTEFDLHLLKSLKWRGYNLSVDMQSFVRQVDPVSKEITFGDVARKREIVSLMSKVKLDVVEAKVLTGTDDLAQAAKIIAGWGCPEVVITQSEGVLAYDQGDIYYEKFSNRSVVGRTGRGDTTFAAYLARRMDHGVLESLKFAAALVSIKMESVGPFSGSIQAVLDRMARAHCT